MLNGLVSRPRQLQPTTPIGNALHGLRVLKAYAQGDERRRRTMRRERLLDAVERHLTPLLAVDDDGIRYLIDTRDRSEITRWIFTWGRYEEPLMRRALETLARETGRPKPLEGRWFADVGANIGSATLCAVLRFGAVRALSLEPHPDNFRMLRLNLLENDLEDRVTPVQAAVSDAPGEVVLEESDENIGDHRVRVGEAPGGVPGAQQRSARAVPAVTLDAASREAGLAPGDAGLVWIDVQGHERRVLAGMEELLHAGVPVVVEYWPYGLGQAGDLDEFHELLAARFTRAFDLGATHVDPGAPVALAAGGVPGLGARLQGEEDFTNLLLLA